MGLKNDKNNKDDLYNTRRFQENDKTFQTKSISIFKMCEKNAHELF